MNIVIIIAYYAPAWAYGGPPRIVYEISKKLVQRKHSVTVFTTDAFEEDKRIDKSFNVLDGITIYYLKNISNYLAWNQKIFLPAGQRRALEKDIEKFDVGFIADLRNMQNAVAYKVFQKHNVPYIVSAYGSLPRAGSIKKYLKIIFDKLWGYDILRNAARVFAQTDNEKKEYLKLGVREDKVEMIPLGVEFDWFESNKTKKGTFRKKYNLPVTDKIILFLGRIHILKFTPVFIQVFNSLSDKYDNLRLVIAGRDDGYLETAKRELKGKEDRYIFVGPLYDKEKLAAYTDADVFCLAPSHYEETSTAALEALACGTPAVITEQCEIPGLDDSGAGMTVKYDADDLYGALEKVLFFNASGENVSEKAKMFIKQNYDWGKIITRLENIFKEAVEQKNNKK